MSCPFSHLFSREDLIRYEQRLFSDSFKLDVAVPTRYDFCQFFSKAGSLSCKERCLVEYLTELSYLDFNFNYFPASKVSAAAIHLTLQV